MTIVVKTVESCYPNGCVACELPLVCTVSATDELTMTDILSGCVWAGTVPETRRRGRVNGFLLYEGTHGRQYCYMFRLLRKTVSQ